MLYILFLLLVSVLVPLRLVTERGSDMWPLRLLFMGALFCFLCSVSAFAGLAIGTETSPMFPLTRFMFSLR